jgi:hypothetical protein
MESPASARAMLRAAPRRTGRPSGARRVCAPRLLGARRRTAGPRANTTRDPGAPVIGVLARSFVQSRRSARTGAESRETGRAGTLAPADTDVDAIISDTAKSNQNHRTRGRAPRAAPAAFNVASKAYKVYSKE